MAKVKLQGQIKAIGQTQQITDKFRKRSILLDEGSQWPSVLNVEFHNDNCGILDNFTPGQVVECDAEITGREYKETAFNTLKAWKIIPVMVDPPLQTPAPKKEVDFAGYETDSDLPF